MWSNSKPNLQTNDGDGNGDTYNEDSYNEDSSTACVMVCLCLNVNAPIQLAREFNTPIRLDSTSLGVPTTPPTPPTPPVLP